MKRLMLLVPVAAIALAGCHKQAAPAEQPQAQAAPATGGAPADAPPTPPPAPSGPPPLYVTANADDTLRANVTGDMSPFLTQQLRLFIQDNRRLPVSFSEFAAKRLDSVPRPPEGQKWVIDSATQEVKAVSK